MALKWKTLIAQIVSKGYDGSADDLDAVSKWFTDNGWDPSSIDVGEGQTVELKALHGERNGKSFDASDAVKSDEFDAKLQAAVRDHLKNGSAVDDEVDRRLKEIEEATGLKTTKGDATNPHTHEVDTKARVEVGKDRLADDPKGGFKSFGHFAQDVKLSDPMGQVTKGLDLWTKATLSTYGAEGVGSDGGFAVPTEFREAIIVHIESEDGLFGRTDQYPISGANAVTFPDDETTPWGSTGIQAAWEGEAQPYTQRKPILKQKELKPRKVTCLIPMTDELMADAGAMGTYLTRKAGQVLSFKVDDAIINGTGAGQPLGILNASSTISIAKETAQVATSFVAVNALKMWSRMYGPYRRNAIWVINQDVEVDLMRMAVTGKTTGGTETTSFGGLVYLPAGNIAGSPFGTLLGRPVVPHQACQTLGTAGDVILASFPQYAVGLRGGLESASSMHLWFDQDVTAFKFRMRVDGQPWLSAAISPKNGSNTMSAFLTTAVRA